jgi:polyhydroxyalkanoate synthase
MEPHPHARRLRRCTKQKQCYKRARESQVIHKTRKPEEPKNGTKMANSVKAKTARKATVKKPVSPKNPAKNAGSHAEQHTHTAHDAQELAQNMAHSSELWQQIMQIILQQNTPGDIAGQSAPAQAIGQSDPVSFTQSMLDTLSHVQVDPENMVESGLHFASEHLKLLQHMSDQMLGKEAAPYIAESPRDKRFKDDGWKDSAWFDYLKQSYLINARFTMENADTISQGLSAHEKNKLQFFTKQLVDAVSPSNFALSNPKVLRTSYETNGQSLVKGLSRLKEDLEKSSGRLRITMSDDSAFTLGKNIAATKGSVVFQNDLIQLIQYAPSTAKVHRTPILLTPAWINKFYILDLAPGNSLAEWLVKKGFTVFIISWANPDQKLADKQFEDYMLEGPLAALKVIETITKSKQTNMVGYCLGGTLTAATLAYLQAKGQANRVASATYLTTLIDFSNAGDLSVFVDEAQLASLEKRMDDSGYLDAADMSHTFNMLRANDLIWSFVINNYLLGKEPLAFDMLYWNSDATRMPATTHAFYLRKMYQENALMRPGGISLANTPLNLAKITTPSYILATRDDHIAPWMGTYAATQLYDAPIHFTLADSGHVAGVINGPEKNKYRYWSYAKHPAKPENWFAKATEHEGSWWPNWLKFLKPKSGALVAARKPGSHKKYPPLEKAPGSYVKVRA